jgi:hypothetical protein
MLTERASDPAFGDRSARGSAIRFWDYVEARIMWWGLSGRGVRAGRGRFGFGRVDIILAL